MGGGFLLQGDFAYHAEHFCFLDALIERVISNFKSKMLHVPTMA